MLGVESADQKWLAVEEISLVGCRFQTTTKNCHQRVDRWQEVYHGVMANEGCSN